MWITVDNCVDGVENIHFHNLSDKQVSEWLSAFKKMKTPSFRF